MVKLFTYEGYNVVVAPEALMLEPFKKLYKRDRSKSKTKVMMEFAYIYFMCDPRSDFMYIIDEVDRSKEIIKAQGMHSKWKPDKMVKEAMVFYSSFKSTASIMIDNNRKLIAKLLEYADGIDLKEELDNGKPKFGMKEYAATIKEINDLTIKINDAEKTLTANLNAESKMKGQGEKTVLEDGDF